jgi:quercetin dioxygenase-like cupin family protein
MSKFFPSPIRKLPRADIPLKGIVAFLSQGKNHQVVFSEYMRDADIPIHSHATQWGVVLKGKIKFTINRKTSTYNKGDVFYIPAGMKHSSRVFAEYADIQFFDEKARFRARR